MGSANGMKPVLPPYSHLWARRTVSARTAFAVRPSPKDSPSADGHPAARTLWALGDAYCVLAAGPEPLPRLIALATLALAHPLVLVIVRLVLGRGLGGDRHAHERKRPGTRRREPLDAQEGWRAPRDRERVMKKCTREYAGVCTLGLLVAVGTSCVRGDGFCSLCFVSLIESCEVGRMRFIRRQ
jgi:hypothetical protein